MQQFVRLLPILCASRRIADDMAHGKQ